MRACKLENWNTGRLEMRNKNLVPEIRNGSVGSVSFVRGVIRVDGFPVVSSAEPHSPTSLRSLHLLSGRTHTCCTCCTCCRHIVEREGPRALFKGLGPNLVGVAPSRAIYFCAYSQSKEFLNTSGVLPPNSAAVHVCSASCAGQCRGCSCSPSLL